MLSFDKRWLGDEETLIQIFERISHRRNKRHVPSSSKIRCANSGFKLPEDRFWLMFLKSSQEHNQLPRNDRGCGCVQWEIKYLSGLLLFRFLHWVGS